VENLQSISIQLILDTKVGEIEMVVDRKENRDKAIEEILAWAKSHQFKVGGLKGKVIEYVKKNDQNHYQALLSSEMMSKKIIEKLLSIT